MTEITVRHLKGLYKGTLKPKAKSMKVRDTKIDDKQDNVSEILIKS